jgi:WD40 repeat protein
VKLWDVTNPNFNVLERHGSLLTSVVFSRDGKQLAVARLDEAVTLWDPSMGNQFTKLRTNIGHVFSVAFSPDGERLATGSLDLGGLLTVKLWDLAGRQELMTLRARERPAPYFVFPCSIVAFSPNGKTLATGHLDGTLKLWNAGTGEELATLTGHAGQVQFVSYSPDGKTLATAGRVDKAVKLWDAATHQERATLKGHLSGVLSVAFSPDGKTLATGDFAGTIKTWNAATGRELLTFKGQAERIHSLAYTPDGRRLATGSLDQTVKLWDVATGEEVISLKHEGWVWFVAFSPDGKTLATGTQQAVYLWRAASEQEIQASGPPSDTR